MVLILSTKNNILIVFPLCIHKVIQEEISGKQCNHHVANSFSLDLDCLFILNLASTYLELNTSPIREAWELYLSPPTCTLSSLSSTSSLFPSVLSSFSSLPFTSSSQFPTTLSASPNAWYSCRWSSRVQASWSRAWWEERSSAGMLFSSDRGREDWYRRSSDGLYKVNTIR